MTDFVGDHITTAAVTVSKKHVGELELSGRAAIKRDLDLKAHRARMDGNRWAQTLKLLIGKRNELRDATDPDSLFPGRNDEACVSVVKRAASALGPSINEAVRMQRVADDRAAEFERQIAELESGDAGQWPGMTNVEMSAMLHADNEAKLEAIAKDGCCGGTPMSDGICFGVGTCPRVGEIQSCSRFCERLIAWTNELENQPQPENLE